MKPNVRTKRRTVGLIKVKSRNASLHMLLVCIKSYQKSVLKYKLLILDTYQPDTTGLFEMIVGVLTTCQFGTNSIIVLMFVESQRVHI